MRSSNVRRFARLFILLVVCAGLLLAASATRAELLVTIGKGKSAVSISDNSTMDLDPASDIIKFSIDGKASKKGDPSGYDVSGTVSLLPGGPSLPGGSILSLSDFAASNPKGDGKGALQVTFSDTVLGPEPPLVAFDSIVGAILGSSGSSLSFQGFVDKSGIGGTFSASTKKGAKGPLPFSDLDGPVLFTKDGTPWDLKGVLTVDVGKGDTISLPGSARVAIGAPEPGAFTLLALGMLGFAGLTFWKRRISRRV